MNKKIRIDEQLVISGLAKDISEARSLVMAGLVVANDKRIDKPGDMVFLNSLVRLKGERIPYVSRGGFKLKGAVDAFNLNMKDKIVLDIGASTGGFSHVALLEGARVVYALDVGKGLIHNKLRNHKRIRLIEGVNFARDAKFELLNEYVDFIVTDVSFISLKQIIPETVKFCRTGTEFIGLIKPQFEVKRDEIDAGGIVTDNEAVLRVCCDIIKFAATFDFNTLGFIKSPINGAKGNVEYLAHMVYSGKFHSVSKDIIEQVISEKRCINS